MCNFDEKLMPEYIKWPDSEAQECTVDFFEDAYSFEGVVGCIDGTHIPIFKPLYCPQDYFTWKQIYAIQLQAVCDECLMFVHIFAGFCGGSHDSYVLQNSQLYLDDKADIKKCFAEPEYHLVQDCAYPFAIVYVETISQEGEYITTQEVVQQESEWIPPHH